jgi:hypothetical protein
MTRKLLLGALLPACIALLIVAQLSAVPAPGESIFGNLGGVTRDITGQPLPRVQVIAHSVDPYTSRTVVSGSDGAFTVENLKPGHYQLMASKEGFVSSSGTTVELAERQNLRVEITLAALNGSKGANDPAPPPAVTENSGRTPPTEREKQLLDRIDRLEQHLAAMEAKEVKGATQTAATTDPVLASLDAAGGLPPAEKGKVLSTIPTPGTAAAKPSGASLAGAAMQTAGAETKPEEAAPPAPFSYADWTWLNGNSRNKDSPLDSKYFTGEFRADTNYTLDYNHPRDDSLGGSTETFRSNEVQVEQLSLGGDLHVGNARGRILTMFGMFATTTPRNDASTARGQWDLRNAYRYVSEAYGGYHWNVSHGLNLDAGIFVSYIGLFSYYNFDNWTYQPSYVSSNTPWFFNGVRLQWFPTDKLKIEPWFINGWQSYARTNSKPGVGGQILWRPKPWLSLVFNNYAVGRDALGVPARKRIHTDDSIQIRYYNRPNKFLDSMAFSFTADAGCEYGGGVSCHGGKGGPNQEFLGAMLYNRFQFLKDTWGLTIGGGQLSNPGRYLTLLPPINGADAISGSPYFTLNPGDKYNAYDGTITLDYMPSQFVTFRLEEGFRHADVPYWSGRGGITPPGGNNGAPTQFACITGSASGATDLPTAEKNCGGGLSSVWFPDLRKSQATTTIAIMVRF